MFGWRDVLNGLDEGLDVAKTIAAIVPGGQGVAIGLGALDTIVSKANETYGVKSLPAPIQTSLDILEGVVKAKDNGSGVRIDNNAVVSLLEVVAKSTGNGLDDKIICMIKAYIGCTGQVSEDINYNLQPLPQQQVQPYNQQPKLVPGGVNNTTGETIYTLEKPVDTSKLEKAIVNADLVATKLNSIYSWDKPEPKPKQITEDLDDDFKASKHERSHKYID